jgi:glutamate formiminotransferase
MKKILEAIPNFSTSDPAIIKQLQSTIEEVDNIAILDTHTDPDHNRTVITYAGDPNAVIEASFKAVKTANELINISKHKGQHPRIGATDVLPFIPIQNISDQEAIKLVHKLGSKIAEELKIPIYFYQKAALHKNRENLEDIRRTLQDQNKKRINSPSPNKERGLGGEVEWAPDLGPKNHHTSGSIVIGVRQPLIAYNINLKTNDVKIAKKIAKAIRSNQHIENSPPDKGESFRFAKQRGSGGLPHLKALGFYLAEKNCAQVSMNLTDYKITNVHHAYDAVKAEADKMGIQILESELVGLIPQEAAEDAMNHNIKLHNFSKSQILENRIRKAAPCIRKEEHPDNRRNTSR